MMDNYEDLIEKKQSGPEAGYYTGLEKNLQFYFSGKMGSVRAFETDVLCEVPIQHLDQVLEGLRNNLEFSLDQLNHIQTFESRQRSFLLLNLCKNTNRNSTFVKVELSKTQFEFDLKKALDTVQKYYRQAERFDKNYDKSDLYNDLKVYDQMPEGLDCIDIHATLAGEEISEVFLDDSKTHVHHFFDFSRDDLSKIIAKISLIDHKAGIFPEICFCMGIENHLKVKVPKRAQYIRMLLSELYRISNHLSYIANISGLLENNMTFNLALIEREKVFRVIEHITGSRVHPNFIRIGGVKKDVNEEILQMIRDSLAETFQSIRKIETITLSDPILFKTLDGCAPMNSSQALKAGLSGPNLRASGIRYDIRKNEKYLLYQDIAFVIPLGRKGDCLDRLIVRFKELYQSLKILKHILEKMPLGAIGLMLLPSELALPHAPVISTTECPHGIMKTYVEVQGNKLLAFLDLCASRKSLFAAEQALKGSRFDDLNLIIASFDLCPSELLDYRW